MELWEAEVRVREMDQLMDYNLDDVTKAREYLKIAYHNFHRSVTALGEGDFKQCLTLLNDCHFPLKEAQKFARYDAILVGECARLEKDINYQMCVAESVQERVKGEELLMMMAVHDAELQNIDMIWEVAELLRRAALMTRGRDLEMDAMTLSALGRVFDKVLTQKDRAKACLMKVIELANTKVHMIFTGEEWYEFARSAVERFQQEQVMATDEPYQKEREEVMNLLKEDLDTLNAKKKDLSKMGFLKFIYTTYPPKNPLYRSAEVPDPPEWGQLKKLYQKAVIHYHPDKVDVEEHGKTWKVLSGEITKLLTSNYEGIKKEPE
ncbi:hypothetical protein ACOMHN_040348 [Nucella lapillus]